MRALARSLTPLLFLLVPLPALAATVTDTSGNVWTITGVWTCGSGVCSTPATEQTPVFTPSPSGTTIPSATQIIDSADAIWTVTNGVVFKNGATAGYTANVTLLLYYSSVIYQENNAGGWWSWTGSGWANSADPRPIAPPPPPPPPVPPPAPAGLLYGVNLSGAEWGGNIPGTYGVDYWYPTTAELSYYKAKGLTLIRLPFLWERMQTSLDAPLNQAQIGYINTVLTAADSIGLSVILDAHDYGRYNGNVIGTSSVPNSAFANFWLLMATQFGSHPSLLGYDLMNEPHDMGAPTVWPAVAQAAVNTIRTVDNSHYIFVEGDGWSGTQSWQTINGNLNITDPANLVIYEAHSYWDTNNSGSYGQTYAQQGATPQTGVNDLQPFAAWISQHGYKGYVGEYGVPENDPSWFPALSNFMTALQQDGLWGTYWAGGPWWSWCNTTIVIEPCNGQDAPQMGTIQQFPSH